jgi:DNA-3-methyladenine glycosylase
VTKRNLAEYLKGGHIYIYLVYGNYYQLNITTYKEGYPECVLIRSLEPINSKENPKGPGKLCQYLKLDSSFWGEDVCQSKKIWLMNGEKIKENDIIKAKRIGIDYAGEDANLLWRFYIKNNQWVSRK